MPPHISVDAAIRLVLLRARARRAGRVPLGEALGLRLASPVRADRDQPPFDRATLDGYAVRSSDPAVGREALAVPETVFAGARPAVPLRPGCAALVMTGAPLPRGADAVIRREDAVPLGGGGFVLLRERPRPGDGVHSRASDARRGTVAVPAGTVVTPRVTAVLASLGAVRPEVYLPPRVAVGATGDELRPASVRALPPAAIRNSNGPTLEALVRAAGGVPLCLGSAGDREAEILALVRRGLAAAEMVLLTGGVSAGDRDLVPPVLARAGVRQVFHRVDMKPGKPVWFGVKGRTLVFGLPGNPVSAQVTFALLAAPALAALRGDPSPGPALEPARLEGGAPREGGRTAFRPAAVRRDRRGRLRARLVPWNGSGDFVGFARAGGLVRREARAAAARDGDPCEVLLLDQGV
jgi:molybdopterin molybdotransferase